MKKFILYHYSDPIWNRNIIGVYIQLKVCVILWKETCKIK